MLEFEENYGTAVMSAAQNAIYLVAKTSRPMS
jgi:hypothetical protein